MSDWQVGDLALCLKGDWTGARYGSKPEVHPETGCIYKVTSLQLEGYKLRLRFAEFGYHAWNATGFRKIRPDEAEGSIEDWNLILETTKRKVPAGEHAWLIEAATLVRKWRDDDLREGVVWDAE